MSSAATLDDLLDPLCDVIAAKLAKRLERGRERLIAQGQSELGARQHRAAVQRRIANDEGGAFIRGRKHLLTLEAYHEELARGSSRVRKAVNPRASVPASSVAPLDDYERTLVAGLRRVSSKR